jgi:hypothetical protein
MLCFSSAFYDVHGLFFDPGAGGAPRTPQGFELDPGWQVAECELLSIEKLRDDWDGMGAKAPDPKVVESAFIFLDSIRVGGDSQPPESISASPRGRIVFSWQCFEAEIVDPTRISFFREFPDGEVASWSIDLTTSSVRERNDVQLDKSLVETSYLSIPLYRIEPLDIPQNEAWGQG